MPKDSFTFFCFFKEEFVFKGIAYPVYSLTKIFYFFCLFFDNLYFYNYIVFRIFWKKILLYGLENDLLNRSYKMFHTLTYRILKNVVLLWSV